MLGKISEKKVIKYYLKNKREFFTMLEHPEINKRKVSTIESEINRKFGKLIDFFNLHARG